MSNELGEWDPKRDLPELNRIGIELGQMGRPVDARLVMKAAQELYEGEDSEGDPAGAPDPPGS